MAADPFCPGLPERELCRSCAGRIPDDQRDQVRVLHHPWPFDPCQPEDEDGLIASEQPRCQYCLGNGRMQVLVDGVHVERPCTCPDGVIASDGSRAE